MEVHDPVFGRNRTFWFSIQDTQIPNQAISNIVTVSLPSFRSGGLLLSCHLLFPMVPICGEGVMSAENNIADFFVFEVTGLCHDNDVG